LYIFARVASTTLADARWGRGSLHPRSGVCSSFVLSCFSCSSPVASVAGSSLQQASFQAVHLLVRRQASSQKSLQVLELLHNLLRAEAPPLWQGRARSGCSSRGCCRSCLASCWRLALQQKSCCAVAAGRGPLGQLEVAPGAGKQPLPPCRYKIR